MEESILHNKELNSIMEDITRNIEAGILSEITPKDCHNYTIIPFENKMLDITETNLSILDFETVLFRKCKIKGGSGIVIYNFKNLSIEDCIFEGFSNRVLIIESPQELNSEKKPRGQERPSKVATFSGWESHRIRFSQPSVASLGA